MSKQSEAKLAQGYVEKNERNCAHCKYFISDKVKKEGHFQDWTEEKNLRCTIGNFTVKKLATCNNFEQAKK